MRNFITFFILILVISCDKSDLENPADPDIELWKTHKWKVLHSTPDKIRSWSKNDDIYFLDENIGWVIGSGTRTVYKTTNGGLTWNLILEAPEVNGVNAYFRSIGFLNEQTGYVGVLYGKEYGQVLFETRDGAMKEAATEGAKKEMKWTLISDKDPVASSLGYVHDINKADKAKFPQWKAENTCTKCLHFVEIKNDDGSTVKGYGQCKLLAATMAPGGPVITSGGWCSVFAPKA
jgi:hypothetical protein